MDAMLAPITDFMRPEKKKKKRSSGNGEDAEEKDALVDDDVDEDDSGDERDDHAVEMTFMDSACNSILPGAGIVSNDGSRRGGFYKMVIPLVPNAGSLVKAVGHQIATRDQKNRSDQDLDNKSELVQNQIESATRATIDFIEEDVAKVKEPEDTVRPRGRSSSTRGGRDKKDKARRRKKDLDQPVKVVV
jgi:hypothetical protein